MSLDLELENQIAEIQHKIKVLTEEKPPPPLTPVPEAPNLARGAKEMWAVYQYQMEQYQKLDKLPTEMEFLKSLMPPAHFMVDKIAERIHLLQLKEKRQLPLLRQPMTQSRPMSLEDKIKRAHLIKQHLCERSELNPMDNGDQIKQLQDKLMDLEEQYLLND